ncbi:MAG: DEAD/DEAH box helicase [Planctomycetaceae bacterium]|nr:DEAD/DEAH box helicase [Planctomycetaceae bacterium]
MDVVQLTPEVAAYRTPGGIPVRFRLEDRGFCSSQGQATRDQLALHLTLGRLQLLRGFDRLLCLEGVNGVEHLPHQIETVRKVLRRFRGRVLLADEVGLGKTIEACLLLREYLLRGLARRILILVPNPLVTQWRDELEGKFGLDFKIPPRTATSSRPEFWQSTDRVLVSTSFARTGSRPAAIAAAPWDIVVVDEAHHCKNPQTKLWQLVNSLQRRYMFLLTATPVQNNLVELYNLLTLLEPGHLQTAQDFKRQFVRRGNPRDPRNRHRLRALLGEVMIRNTRSLVQIDLPPRYAQTIVAVPGPDERQLHDAVHRYLRQRTPPDAATSPRHCAPCEEDAACEEDVPRERGLSRLQIRSILAALGSHPTAVADSLEKISAADPEAARLRQLAARITHSAKDERLLELLRDSHGHRVLIFVHSLRTLHRVEDLLTDAGFRFATFSGEQSRAEKDAAVERFRDEVPILLCTDAGGEGHNLQFADTLINYDLPWNPMRIEQRIGRLHRYGQTQDVFVFNLCTENSLESRILALLNDKIRMFELVVGEIGSILGNLDDGDEFESVVLRMWMKAGDERQLAEAFTSLGDALLDAQSQYLESKELDDALFGEDFE